MVQARSANVANVVKSLSRTITSSAGPQADWPFYTVEDMNALTEDFTAFDPDAEIVYSPIVSQAQRDDWEDYSVDHQSLVTGTKHYDYEIPHFIYSRHGDTIIHNDTGPFSPVWQITPPPYDFRGTANVNYNLFSNPTLQTSLQSSYLSRQQVISSLTHHDHLYGMPLLQKDIVRAPLPLSLTVQPIMQGFQNQSQIVAHLFATIPWTYFLNNTLAHEKDQLFCVIEHSCTYGDSTTYTYVLSGGNGVEFYGMGDLHLTKYDDFTQTVVLSSFGFLDEEDQVQFCNITLSLYPTGAMQWRYNSNASVTHLLALVFFVFVLVGISIMTHHRITDARLRDTQAQGKRSKAIIASLFPETIREKLFDVQGEVNIDKLGLLNSEAQKAIKTTGDDAKVEDLWGARDNYGDVYKNCTVCIADICGEFPF